MRIVSDFSGVGEGMKLGYSAALTLK